MKIEIHDEKELSKAHQEFNQIKGMLNVLLREEKEKNLCVVFPIFTKVLNAINDEMTNNYNKWI